MSVEGLRFMMRRFCGKVCFSDCHSYVRFGSLIDHFDCPNAFVEEA